ncbi:MAG TPA: hypothetical protein VEW93_13025 [Acidimicrobiales bacterium]|nr:hypothetical protein [Acidimicrobiales bacterium]
MLVPPFVRNRTESRPGSSVVSFKQGLDVLGRATPGAALSSFRGARDRPVGSGSPRGRAAARKRRRDVLFALGGAAAFTLLLAVAFGGSMVALHLLVDAGLGGYVYLLVQMRKSAAERSHKVRYLAVPPQSQPTLVTLRRSASG